MKSYTGSKNGKKRQVTVEQVENGYVICVTETSDEGGYSCKKYISEDDPFTVKPVWEEMEEDDD